MRRLYLQIYLTVIGSLVLFAALAAATWALLPSDPVERRAMDGIAALLAHALPKADPPSPALQERLERLGRNFASDITLRARDGRVLAHAGRELPLPEGTRARSGWTRARGGGHMLALRLPDGRLLLARRHREQRRHGFAPVVALSLLAIAIAVAAYPVVRRLTGRLERLQQRVEQLGAGDLEARVEVEGKDEISDLAHSFNRAADRIERLVGAQRAMLAAASHELRSPLTRIRMALELLDANQRPELRAQVLADIGELDELIEELLLASRLQATAEMGSSDQIDLLALAAEEGARAGADVTGEPISIRGDRRLIRRLIRNLLDNARRYAGSAPIEIGVERVNGGGGARLRVADRGPGVAAEERERIFEPFYRPAGMRESADGGVGLGLALVRQIARRHGGDAICRPRDGGGTCFDVTLGAAPTRSEAPD